MLRKFICHKSYYKQVITNQLPEYKYEEFDFVQILLIYVLQAR